MQNPLGDTNELSFKVLYYHKFAYVDGSKHLQCVAVANVHWAGIFVFCCLLCVGVVRICGFTGVH